jgi:transketolase
MRRQENIMPFELRPRRALYLDIASELAQQGRGGALAEREDLAALDGFDDIYRALCALLFNYVPTSGHPGGSISSGRIAASLVFGAMDYDLGLPEREDADLLIYAAGHKAMGLYALWALRDEVARLAAPDLLPAEPHHRLRLEDLLGFRRNPAAPTPLAARHRSRPLDGHPTPATPFVRLATGASGVGVAAGLGLALGARDWFGPEAPLVHLLEGEGGLTPGRVAEALAAGGTLSLANAILHVDWNQSSIDSDRVCADGDQPGDYVQWDPVELAYLHDWNVVWVPDGFDLEQIAAAQSRALAIENGQPTAVVYRTVKGWQYGIEGRSAHGAGHGLCSPGFYQALRPLTDRVGLTLPFCEGGDTRCAQGRHAASLEECFWSALLLIRETLARSPEVTAPLARRLRLARTRLDGRERRPRPGAPKVENVFAMAHRKPEPPAALRLEPGATTTLRGELGRVLDCYNRESGGAIFAAAADLLGSTSVNVAGGGFAPGFYQADSNPDSRLIAVGGICEDAMCGLLSGLSTFGRHLGAGSSYGAFIAALGHVPARLHAIGAQARREISGAPYSPFFLICAHAGLKTG